jgi:hypothetical protein
MERRRRWPKFISKRSRAVKDFFASTGRACCCVEKLLFWMYVMVHDEIDVTMQNYDDRD